MASIYDVEIVQSSTRQLSASDFRELADILELRRGERLSLRPPLLAILSSYGSRIKQFDDALPETVVRDKLEAFTAAFTELEAAVGSLDTKVRDKLREHGRWHHWSAAKSIRQLDGVLADNRQLLLAAREATKSVHPARRGERKKIAITLTIRDLLVLYNARARHANETLELDFVSYALRAAGIRDFKATNRRSHLGKLIREQTKVVASVDEDSGHSDRI